LKNQVENDFVSANSRVAGIAENLANYKMYFGDTNLINTELDRYLAVTKEDIMNAAIKYYQKDNRVVLHYLPKPVEP
jgi:predicted Zn-dependent peptidase